MEIHQNTRNLRTAAQILFHKKENIDRWLRFMKSLAEGDDEQLRYLVYEVVVEYLFCNNIHHVMEQTKKGDIGFQHPSLENIRMEFAEQDDFLENPPEVEEGVMECKRCQSKRTFSFSKQTRRSDESATVFIRCSNCSFMYKM